MEGRQGPMRGKCGGRAAGHTALSVRENEEAILKTATEKTLPLISCLNGPSWVWRPAPEEEQEAIPRALTLNAVCVHVWLSLIPFLLLEVE